MIIIITAEMQQAYWFSSVTLNEKGTYSSCFHRVSPVHLFVVMKGCMRQMVGASGSIINY